MQNINNPIALPRRNAPSVGAVCRDATRRFGACPVDGDNPDYLGPAALAKLYRFYIDPREVHDDSRLLLADKPSGWWACQFHANCKRVCPKGVPPNLAIGQARRILQDIGKKA